MFSGVLAPGAAQPHGPHLLHHQFGRSHSDGDAHVGQFVQDVLEVQVPPGLGSGEGAALKQTQEVNPWKHPGSEMLDPFGPTRTAPWHVVPNVSVIPCSVPVRT